MHFYPHDILIYCNADISNSKEHLENLNLFKRNTVSMPNLLYISAAQHVNNVTITYAINVFHLQPLSEQVIPLRGAYRPDLIRAVFL